MIQDAPIVEVDIVSDVMCPWCIIGYRQLEAALARTAFGMRVRWHPFELNPGMPPEGQNLGAHIAEKYGATPAQSAQTRAQMTALGAQLGFDFRFSEDSRIVNTFAAHQLLELALAEGKQHPLKMALFTAHFTQSADVSDPAVLIAVAAEVGMDPKAAETALSSGALARSVRDKQAFWAERRITGVPSMIFGGRYLVTGAQGIDTYEQLLRRIAADAA